MRTKAQEMGELMEDERRCYFFYINSVVLGAGRETLSMTFMEDIIA